MLGQGNSDHTAEYEVVNLGGSLAADMTPIRRIDGVRGTSRSRPRHTGETAEPTTERMA